MNELAFELEAGQVVPWPLRASVAEASRALDGLRRPGVGYRLSLVEPKDSVALPPEREWLLVGRPDDGGKWLVAPFLVDGRVSGAQLQAELEAA